MKWLSGIDVNAVFAAVVAAIAYVHNHNFRVRRDAGTPPSPTSPAAAVAVVLCVALALACVSSCASSQKRDVYAAAVATCSIGTLATVDAKLSQVEAQHSTESSAVFALELLTQEAVCIHATVRAAAVLQGSGSE